jgi:hypothetical protein
VLLGHGEASRGDATVDAGGGLRGWDKQLSQATLVCKLYMTKVLTFKYNCGGRRGGPVKTAFIPLISSSKSA